MVSEPNVMAWHVVGLRCPYIEAQAGSKLLKYTSRGIVSVSSIKIRRFKADFVAGKSGRMRGLDLSSRPLSIGAGDKRSFSRA